ncbi:hypothetical protein L6164_011526 [Bauhinia variegata]|uniref:Uncharacterized protein n=1 Tax=Bauhinia variegata TaxID=167791 RepID=A0ACB9P6Z8_BAUVA|nr:hypothetical protein L6164_011526 [Bauhinia variegata]
MKPTETIISTPGLEAKAIDKDFVEITNEEQVVQKNPNAEASKKQNAEGLGVKKTVELKRNKSVMIWCEVCQLQVPSRAMETHKNGTKHRARMLIFTKNKGSVPESFTILSETTLTKDTDAVNVLTKETNMKMTDNFANSDKPSVPPKTGQMGKPDYEREAIMEDEVIRDLMLERELAMLTNMGKELSLEEQIGMRLSPELSHDASIK